VTAARFPFVPRNPALGSASLAPMLPLTLAAANTVAAVGLLDTGATVNVMPFSVGIQLGADWDQLTTTIQLTGNLAAIEARALVVTGTVGSFPSLRLAFAWAKTDAIPILLGQMSFFLEFDVCFFRSQGEFEIRPKGTPWSPKRHRPQVRLRAAPGAVGVLSFAIGQLCGSGSATMWP
jgi:hypothetical protein